MKTAEEIGRATLERLAANRLRSQARSAAVRARIGQLAASDAGPERGRAKRIMKLMSEPVPPLRTVQWHLNAIAQARRRCAND